MALVITVAMVLGMTSMAAFASEPTAPTAPTSGSITINSPVVGANYKIYKIFDMTTNANVDAFSYTLSVENDFYGAVVAYASDPQNGLILSRIQGSDPATYNVSVSTADSPVENYGTFDAQKFGKAMQEVIPGGAPAVEADPEKGIVAKDRGPAITEDASKLCTITTDNTSDQLVFDGDNHEGIKLGYYLVNPTYPAAASKTAKLGEDTENEKTFTLDADFVKGADGKVTEPLTLTDAAKEKINDYAEATVDVDKYIEDHGITTNKDGSPLNDAGKDEYEADLIAAIKADAEAQILAVFNNENGDESDINVKEPILVFLDSSQPDAIINEKNELDKWDVPVNPQAGVQPGQPDHGEPDGGKNIIVEEENPETQTAAYSADWSEAEIGESVHYQLRVNAMNFIRTGEDDTTIQQVKEYFLADYQSGYMHFDETKGLRVTVWQGDNANNSQASTKVNVTRQADGSAPAEGYLDYTDKVGTFFKNSTDEDANPAPTDVFGENGTGIMVPWVFVYDPSTVQDDPETTDVDESEAALAAKISQFPIYTITNVPVNGEFETEEFKLDGNNRPIPVKEVNDQGEWVDVPGRYVSIKNHIVNGDKQVLDENGNPIQKKKPVYTFSLYNSDVTIVVDYWMILDNDAIVDEPGNKNYAQYGWSPIDNKDNQGNPKEPTNPNEEDKPSQKEKVDEATVYTFALAWVKVNEQAEALADAEFELPFYVKLGEDGNPLKDGNAYVFAFKPGTNFNEEAAATYPEDKSQDPNNDGTYPKFTKDNTTNLVTTDATGVITIKGVEQGTYTITETKAPAGYNQLTAPFDVEAKKSGPTVTTKTKTIIYLDAQGNVTETVTTATEEYNTDVDSFNNATATGDEEKSVPVYQFDPIVNKQGTELPSTGGIGTTIFYVVGAILVLGAGIVLITRRRMDG